MRATMRTRMQVLGAVLAVAACSAPDPATSIGRANARVEVLGPAPYPSGALRRQIAKGEDEFVLFDTSLAVRELIVSVQSMWALTEIERARALHDLLSSLADRTDDGAQPISPERRACADAAAVALALLDAERLRESLTESQRDELREVESAADGTLRFAVARTRVSWRDAAPSAAYVRLAAGPGGAALAGMFRATSYLRCYFAHWPRATTTAWAELTRAVDSRLADDLAAADTAARVLFGARDGMPGLRFGGPAPDTEWLASGLRATNPWDLLPALFGDVPVPAPESCADGVLRVCHELASASARDPLFAAMAPDQWQAKWRDEAAFAYVGLREVDTSMRAAGADLMRTPLQIVVEPLPEVWQALRWLERRTRDVEPHRAGLRREPGWIDDVLQALDFQQGGAEIPQELEQRLRWQLLYGFTAPDPLLGTPTAIEGVRGDVRRAAPHLVRVPIRWRGETKRALALRLYVEHEAAPGAWQGPPWGVALQTADGVRAAAPR